MRVKTLEFFLNVGDFEPISWHTERKKVMGDLLLSSIITVNLCEVKSRVLLAFFGDNSVRTFVEMEKMKKGSQLNVCEIKTNISLTTCGPSIISPTI